MLNFTLVWNLIYWYDGQEAYFDLRTASEVFHIFTTQLTRREYCDRNTPNFHALPSRLLIGRVRKIAVEKKQA